MNDVSLDEEVIIKLWTSSESRKFLKEFLPFWDRGNLTNSLLIIQEAVEKLLWNLLRVGCLVSDKPTTSRPQSDYGANSDHDPGPGIFNSVLPLWDRANCENFVGSVALAEVCALRVLFYWMRLSPSPSLQTKWATYMKCCLTPSLWSLKLWHFVTERFGYIVGQPFISYSTLCVWVVSWPMTSSSWPQSDNTSCAHLDVLCHFIRVTALGR